MRRRKGAEVSASECIVGDCRGNRSPKTPSHQLIVPEGEHFVLLDRGPKAEPQRGYGNSVKCVLAGGVELAIRRYAVLLGRVFERGRLKNESDYAGYELVEFGHVAA